MDKVALFIVCFNELSEEHRKIIYYFFFKYKQNEFITRKTYTSERTVKSKKKEAVEEMLAKLSNILLMKKLKRTRSGSAKDSGFFHIQNSKGKFNDEQRSHLYCSWYW